MGRRHHQGGLEFPNGSPIMPRPVFPSPRSAGDYNTMPNRQRGKSASPLSTKASAKSPPKMKLGPQKAKKPPSEMSQRSPSNSPPASVGNRKFF